MPYKFLKILAATFLLAACNSENNKLTDMVIQTENGNVEYRVETALTHEEMSKGLSDRKELAKDSGMIFNLQGIEGIAMWMQDTYIPLDMIFVNKDGRILWIYENAEPLSTKLIHPETNEPIWAVIELNGGDVKQHNIKIGDIVKHQILKQTH